jgi:RNA polymerase sigma factor (sigma-70 family)
MVRCNQRLVIKMAVQFRGMGMPLGDLIQEGNVGLLAAIDRFDWRRGFRFSTYAAFWIRQEIQAAVRTGSQMVRLPVRRARMLGRIAEATRYFQAMEGRDPSVADLTQFLGEPEAKVVAAMAMRESVVSLDADPTGEGNSLLETLPDHGPAPSDRLEREQKEAAVRRALRGLTDRERRVVELRFGFNTGGRSLSLRHTSKHVGLSQEGVRRVENRALAKLSRPAIRSQLAGLMSA